MPSRQNSAKPERGIETVAKGWTMAVEPGQNSAKPERGIETNRLPSTWMGNAWSEQR